MKNPVKQKLLAVQTSIGSWLNLASPIAAEVMANAGFEWLAVDGEHSPADIGLIVEMVRAIESRNTVPLVRAWDARPETLGRILDAGAYGVVVPHVSTAEQAARIASACRYPPEGTRSRGTGRAVSNGPDYYEQANREILVFAQIEDREGIENAEAIMSVPGIDVGFLGPSDLSLEMGVLAGSETHESAIQSFLAVCRALGKPCGIPCADGPSVRDRAAQGFQFLCLRNDLRILESEARRQLAAAFE